MTPGLASPAWEPLVRPGFISRSSLFRALADAETPGVVAVIAPPGYGKSTVLEEWAGRDPRHFISLSAVELEADDAQLTATRASVQAKIKALAATECPFVLMLDDAHLVSGDGLRRLVDEVMRDLPSGCLLALASPSRPALAFGRLRAKHMLLEIGVADLAMTPTEASMLLRESGLELDFGCVQALVRRTEGWPAALYLAALSVREQGDHSAAAVAFRGNDHRIAEYLRDEVFAGWSASMVNFAIRSSILEELSGPVCDGVLGQKRSAMQLAELAEATSLLRPVDPAQERYRWHGLVRDALRAWLDRTEPQLAPILHTRASAWHRRHGDTERAIAHAVCSRDLVLTGDLLWTGVVRYLSQGRNELVQDWLAQFSRDELSGYPPLALAAAYSFLAAGNAAEARHCAAAVAAVVDRESRAGAAGSLAAGLAGIEAMVAPAGVTAMADAAELRMRAWSPAIAPGARSTCSCAEPRFT